MLKFLYTFIIFLCVSTCVIKNVAADYDDSMEYYRSAQEAYIRRDLSAAETLVKKSVSSDKQNEHAYVLLAEILYLKQDMAGAISALKSALKLNPNFTVIRSRLEQMEREDSFDAKLREVKQGIFEICHPEELRQRRGDEGSDMPDPSVAPAGLLQDDSVRLALQEAYEKIGKAFDYYPRHTIVVLLYPADDFYKMTNLPQAVEGMFDGKVRLPLPATRTPLPDDVKAVLWHEYAHAIVYDLSIGKAPMWLHEGIAVYCAAMVKPHDCAKLKEALVAGKTLPLNFLFNPSGRFNAGLFYQESYSVVEYIIQIWGVSGLKKALKTGRLPMKTDALEKRWLSWAKEKYGSLSSI